MTILRLANMSDAARLWCWRTDPLTVEHSLTNGPGSFKEHCEWLSEALNRTSTTLLVAHDTERSCAVGTARLDHRTSTRGKATAVVSITVAPEQRGRGYAGQILAAVIEKARQCDADRLLATVMETNGPSLRAFWSAGFRPVGYKGGAVELARAL